MIGLSDSELIKYFKNGNEGAFEDLFRRYEALVAKIARKYCVPGYEAEDFYQVGAVAFYKAVLSYDENVNSTFYGYVLPCIRNEIVSQFRKQLLLIEYATDFEEITTVLESCEIHTIEKSEIVDEEYDNLLHAYRAELAELLSERKILSPLEKKCLEGFIGGLSYLEIAQEHGIAIKKVDNALMRIRAKIRSRGVGD